LVVKEIHQETTPGPHVGDNQDRPPTYGVSPAVAEQVRGEGALPRVITERRDDDEEGPPIRDPFVKREVDAAITGTRNAVLEKAAEL
jgi:hypothetical protein